MTDKSPEWIRENPSDSIDTTNRTHSTPSKMKIFLVALLASLVAIVFSQGLQVPFINSHPLQLPFLNSTGLTVNSVPYSTRLYWMEQANQALFERSGPW